MRTKNNSNKSRKTHPKLKDAVRRNSSDRIMFGNKSKLVYIEIN